METNFSPGPWLYHHPDSIRDAEGKIIAQIKITYLHNSQEIAANAKLIEAAPDLLMALQIAIGDIEQSPTKFTKEEKVKIIRDAINKATQL